MQKRQYHEHTQYGHEQDCIVHKNACDPRQSLESTKTNLPLLEIDSKNESDEYHSKRRETDLDLTRSYAASDLFLLLKEDEHMGDVAKLKIKPVQVITDKLKEGEIEEVDCGEPFREQHFYIDFTPIPGIDDDEELFQKNDEFWNFAFSNKEMRKMLNLEVIVPPPLLNLPSVSTTKPSTILSSNDILAGVNWLHKNETELAPDSKMQKEYCDVEDDAYFSEDNIVKKNQEYFGNLESTLKIKKLPQTIISRELELAAFTELDKMKLEKLNTDMDEFDTKNPKSFDPPGRSPELITATLQRHPFRGISDWTLIS